MKQNRAMFALLIGLAVLSFGATNAQAHCQIPCGIYDHHARMDGIFEDIATIEKAVKNIGELSGNKDTQSANQLTRWVFTKEKHAQNIQDTVSEYFLAQVVKPADPNDKAAYKKYLKSLADHHAVIVWAMKAKQTADLTVVDKLKDAAAQLATYYPAGSF
jgi:nickel superoxide dismutase